MKKKGEEKRILILSDSLALPRNAPEVTYVEDTYPFFLRETGCDVFQFSKGGGVIKEIFNQVWYYKQYRPDIVILHCGIVDCSPRAYTYREELFFDNFFCGKIIRKALSKTITTRRLRRIRRKKWSSLKCFRYYAQKITEEFPDAKCYALSILPIPDGYEKLAPGAKKNRNQYNQVLRDVFLNKFIDLSDLPLSCIMTDMVHLNKSGHEFVAKRIINTLEKNASCEV